MPSSDGPITRTSYVSGNGQAQGPISFAQTQNGTITIADGQTAIMPSFILTGNLTLLGTAELKVI